MQLYVKYMVIFMNPNMMYVLSLQIQHSISCDVIADHAIMIPDYITKS